MKRRITAAIMVLVLVFALPFAAQAQSAGTPDPGRGAEAVSARRKAGWVFRRKGKYYRKKDGTVAKGSFKISGVYYVFSQKGWLLRPETRAGCSSSEESRCRPSWHWLSGS